MQINWFDKWKKWIIAVAMVLLIQLFSAQPDWVERYYTYGFYPFFSRLLRALLGWIPFSIGDIVYLTVIVAFVYKMVQWVRRIRRKQFNATYRKQWLANGLFGLLVIYIVFYSFWGLNYSRKGVAAQLQLNEQTYTVSDLDTLVHLLSVKLNRNAQLLTPSIRDSFLTKRKLFSNATQAYKIAGKTYPFLTYKSHSVKPSLFSYLGNYMGFQGYYNPFTGEAQVNTTIPPAVEPFVATHEIAHQLGYAKESEANFIGFLACRMHPSIHFQYSVYFDMYQYAIHELSFLDSVKAKSYDSTLHPQVKRDVEDYISFYKKYRNPIEPYIDKAYNYFLKANNQPKGRESYNEVVIWLIAYYKKYGKTAI